MVEIHELRALVAAIPGSSVIVPGGVVAEVMEFTEPQPLPNAPDWLPGEMSWNGWKIPIVNLGRLAGTAPDAAIPQRSRILVIKTLAEDTSILYVGIPISGLPRLQQVTRGSLVESGERTQEGIFSHVSIDGKPAVIPDLDALARLVEQGAHRNR